MALGTRVALSATGEACVVSNAFLSYAREDLEFARRIRDSLQAEGREVWVDIEGIPPSAKWWDEIRRAIERAESVIVLVSPAWLASSVSRQELDHAVSLGKRLIPVVVAEIEDADVPQALRECNWIFNRPTDDHKAADLSVRAALDTDLAWVKDHTDLLVRAVEWGEAGKDRSLLLRGNALAKAEAWLGQAGDHSPSATAQQIEFLVAGRQSASVSARRRAIAVVTALVVAISLAVVALVQRDNAQEQTARAEQQTARAEQQARLAQSQALSATATSLLDTDPELSVLLAAEAYRLATTQEAVQVLRNALSASNVATYGHPGDPSGTAFADVSADGDTVLTLGKDEFSLELFDAATGETSDLEPLDGSVLEASIGADGRGYAWVGASEIVTWDTASGDLSGTAATFDRDPADVDISVDASTAAVLYDGGVIAVLDLANGGRLVTEIETGTPEVDEVVVSQHAKRVAAVLDHHDVVVWDATTGKEQQRRSFPGETVLRIRVGGPNDALVGACGTDVPRAWVVGSDEDITGLAALEGCDGVAFPPTGFEVAFATNELAVIVDVFSGGVLQRTQVSEGFNSITYAQDGRRVVIAEERPGGELTLWRPNHTLAALAGATRVMYADDGATLVAGTDSGAINSADAITGEVVRRLARETSTRKGFITDLAVDGEGLIWVLESEPGFQTSSVTAVDPDTGEDLIEFPLDEGERPMALDTRPGTDDVSVVTSEGLLLVLRDDADAIDLGPGSGSADQVAYSDDGGLLAVAVAESDRSVSVKLYDADSLEPLRTVATNPDRVRGLSFSPDGERVAFAGVNQPVTIVRVEDGEELATLARSDVLVTAWSPDGSVIATGNDDATVTVWDAQTGESLATFAVPESGFDVEFSPDGSSLAVAGTQSVRVYSCDLCVSDEELLDLVASRTGRELTEAERERYHVAS